jgi:hypothetical protein
MVGGYWVFSPVHLYPLRFRRSILTAIMRPSIFLCFWFQHYERLIFHITRDCFSISISRLPSIFTIGWYWRGMFYSLDALYFPVHLYPLRYRRSILTAIMRPSLFLCVWFQHYERLIFHITRDLIFTITRDCTLTLREIALVFQFHACRLYLLSVDIDGGYSVLSTHSTPRPSLPSTLSPVYSYGDYATFPLPLLPYIY